MTKVVDRYGQQRELQDGEMLKDGDRLVVSLAMMDHALLALHDGMDNAAGHKQGYVFASGANASISDTGKDAYGAYETRLADAWRAA